MKDDPQRSYVLGHGSEEHRRLMLQSRFIGELTEAVFARAGLAQGMRVLDVGCGAGDVRAVTVAVERVGVGVRRGRGAQRRCGLRDGRSLEVLPACLNGHHAGQRGDQHPTDVLHGDLPKSWHSRALCHGPKTALRPSSRFQEHAVAGADATVGR